MTQIGLIIEHVVNMNSAVQHAWEKPTAKKRKREGKSSRVTLKEGFLRRAEIRLQKENKKDIRQGKDILEKVNERER